MGDITIRIAAANGDGVESSGDLVAKTFLRSGFNIFAYRSYQSIIRGGHVWYQVRVSNDELHSSGDKINVLIALNQDAIENQGSHLADGAIVLYDGSKNNVESLKGRNVRAIDIRMLDITVQNGGDPILRNVVAIGAVMKIAGIGIEALNRQIKERFGKKGDMIINNNINCALAGYNSAGVDNVFNLKGDTKQRYIIDGNSALAAGAFAGGCRFYAAYPMTPATTVLQWFAPRADHGVMVKQTEDEIAAINMAIGAASTGVRAMCGTSGGGFSLMVEALGLSGMLEIPIVAMNSMRGGPSTGLPTKTEQGDVLFVMHASQGEFPRIVVAPRNIRETFTIGAEVFNLADRYQCPVIVLMDLYLSEYNASVEGFDIDSVTVDRGKIAATPPAGTKFKRYEITEDGVSPRGIPGTPGTEHIAPSDDHDEYGNTITDYYAGIDKYVEIRKQNAVQEDEEDRDDAQEREGIRPNPGRAGRLLLRDFRLHLRDRDRGAAGARQGGAQVRHNLIQLPHAAGQGQGAGRAEGQEAHRRRMQLHGAARAGHNAEHRTGDKEQDTQVRR